MLSDNIMLTLKEFGNLEINTCFKDKTSLKIGGAIEYYLEVSNLEGLQKTIKYLRKINKPYFILGNGTNILASDEHFEVVVISLKRMNHMWNEQDIFTIEAGANATLCGTKITLMGYANPLCLSMIPGSIGGAIYMNASSYGEEIKDYLMEVEYLDDQGDLKILQDFSAFDYRSSPFQNMKAVIVRAKFRFKKDNDRKSLELLEEAWAEKRRSQPLKTKNAGCIFKNPPHDKAWRLIEELGLKKFKIGEAGVSEKHANFLINEGNTNFLEMYALIEYIKKRVFDEYNILLENEIKIIRPSDINPY